MKGFLFKFLFIDNFYDKISLLLKIFPLSLHPKTFLLALQITDFGCKYRNNNYNNQTKMEKNHFHVVRKTSIVATDSLLTMHPGETASIPCGDFCCLSTAMSAACRLNQQSTYKEFEVSSPDNGATIVIKRNPIPERSSNES